MFYIVLFLLQVPRLMPMELMVESTPKRIFANAHTYHINSISINSDQETYLSADDLRINLWHLEVTDQVIICLGNVEEIKFVLYFFIFKEFLCFYFNNFLHLIFSQVIQYNNCHFTADYNIVDIKSF